MGALEDNDLCIFLVRDLCRTPQVTLREVAALSAGTEPTSPRPRFPVEPEELRAIEGEREGRRAQQRSGRNGDQPGRSYRAGYDPLESSTSE
jgi:hypothetical protein